MTTTIPRPEPSDTVRTDRTWDHALRRSAIVYLLSRFFVLMGAGMAVSGWAVFDRINEEVPKSGLRSLADQLVMWDGHWYMDVAREGYPRNIVPNVTYEVPDARAAFFPVYPKFVHYLDNVLPGGPIWVGVAVNFFLGAIFVYLVGRIVRELFDNKTAEKAMMMTALFPGSFVLTVAYSEATLLVLACLCFMALQRRNWVLAGVLAAVASATRPNGLALALACAVAALMAIREDRDWSSLVAPAMAPLGFVGFMLFLRIHASEPWPWFRVQREAWDEGTSFGLTAAQGVFKFLLNPFARPSAVLTFATVSAMVAALYLARRHRIPGMYMAYSYAVLFLMLLPATVTARPRFLFTAFPLIFPVARALRDDDDGWWPLVLGVLATGLVTVMGIYGVRAAIP